MYDCGSISGNSGGPKATHSYDWIGVKDSSPSNVHKDWFQDFPKIPTFVDIQSFK
jgi:hypothetical protein